MEICYGLSVHEKEEDWRVYKTIWEDAVTQAAEVDLAEVTSQNVGDESEQIHRKLTELNQEIQAEEERLEAERAKLVLEEKEREAAREETKEPEEDEIQIEKAEMALKGEKDQRPRIAKKMWKQAVRIIRKIIREWEAVPKCFCRT